MSDRTLNWYESADDSTAIISNGWNFQIAKSVATGTGTPTYNLVWQSQALAPITTISWKVQYALSWTAAVPTAGVKVKIQGQWQKCDKGQSFDIDNNGYWQPSATKPDPTDAAWLKVGNINYSYPGVLGLHIVVGVFNAVTGKFEPIFVDEATLPAGSSGRYQPQETVSWWLEGQDLTGQLFHSTKSRSTFFDFTNPSNPLTGAYEWSTSFVMIGGKWTIAPGDPPQQLTGPPPSAQLAALSLGGQAPIMLQIDYKNWLVTFATPLAAAALASIGAALYNKLKGTFKELKVTVVGTNGTTLKIEYTAGENAVAGTLEFLGTPVGAGGGPQQTIEDALQDLQAGKAIPAEENWEITANNGPKTSAHQTQGPGNESESRANGANGYQALPVGKGSFNHSFYNGEYTQGRVTAAA